MLYRILTEGVVLLHLLFIIFVVGGGVLMLRWPHVALLHLPAAAWGAYVECSGTLCPLTPLENYSRQLAGQEGYSAGFIEHYLVPIVYPAQLTHEIQVLLGLLVVVVNLVVYSFVLLRYYRHSR